MMWAWASAHPIGFIIICAFFAIAVMDLGEAWAHAYRWRGVTRPDDGDE